ncbi:hypothetical protein [Leadbettera azotonutricia]|uniref:Putative lipoprotein n=1 Tax=Leadbettera azotonutricia (strain ATCC BAA-888 / DSM 13862 / ZAS-9) TaxID=545695 RepID=F5Y7A1_LEAAZ|nr:hypothetical protein [Leadbettera azotonutricia]AEF80105.1 putative lipoprotein [Leadbettera azotonutricia ZAS-9]
MKKRGVLLLPGAFVLVLSVFMMGCSDGSDSASHNDASYLVGSWSSSGASFVIAADYTFSCTLKTMGDAVVTGELSFNDDGLGPNDYILTNLANPDNKVGGTAALLSMFPTGILATLEPNADKTTFTFSSTDQSANGFFGGTYIK